jgi:hypothetical protein
MPAMDTISVPPPSTDTNGRQENAICLFFFFFWEVTWRPGMYGAWVGEEGLYHAPAPSAHVFFF